MLERCGACHKEKVKDNRDADLTTLVINGAWGRRLEPRANLSRPEKSDVLRAPLAKAAGGLGLCKVLADGKHVFESTEDPLYQQILSAIRDARERLMASKRFDMPGFRPNEHYIREMQRFGILPKDFGPKDPIDVYATDRAYWDSFYWSGARSVTAQAPAGF